MILCESLDDGTQGEVPGAEVERTARSWAVAMRGRRPGPGGQGSKARHRSGFEPVTYASPDENPAQAYVDSLPSPGSRRVMLNTLDHVAGLLSDRQLDADAFPWSRLRPEHTASLRARLLRSRRSPATVNRYLQALRGALKAAWRLGAIEADVYQRAIDLKPVSGKRLPRGRAVGNREIEALFNACAADESPSGARDAALLAVFLGAGLRRAEVVGLDVDDYDAQSGELRVRSGKGRRERLVYATNGAADALANWLEVRGAEPGPLFGPITRGNRLLIRRMTEQAVYAILRRRQEQAGVEEFSPHDLRRTFISTLLDDGVDLVTVQALAGHANIATTAMYDRRGEKAKKRAAQMLRIPYRAS